MKILIVTILLSVSIGAIGQTDTTRCSVDTLAQATPFHAEKLTAIDRFTHGKLFKSTYIGLPLVVGGLIEKHQVTSLSPCGLRHSYAQGRDP